MCGDGGGRGGEDKRKTKVRRKEEEIK